MIVRYRTDANVTLVRHMHSVADCDKELRAAATMLAFHRGPARRHPSSPRQIANMVGLIDQLLTARVELADAEVLDGVDPWGQLPSFDGVGVPS